MAVILTGCPGSGDDPLEDINDSGTNPSRTIGQEVLYGRWVWKSGLNTSSWVISANQLIRIADQPYSETSNGTYTIDILKWTTIQNMGTNKDTYPSGFRAEGVIIHKSGKIIIGQNVGDPMSTEFYLNSQKDKLVISIIGNATVYEKQ